MSDTVTVRADLAEQVWHWASEYVRRVKEGEEISQYETEQLEDALYGFGEETGIMARHDAQMEKALGQIDAAFGSKA